METPKKRKETYKLTFGWLKKCGTTKPKYVMPRQGGGARKAEMPRTATYKEMLETAQNLFNVHVNSSNKCYLGNYQGEEMRSTLTCEELVKSSNFVKLPRLYLVTEISETISR
jgi:hypothetical protein